MPTQMGTLEELPAGYVQELAALGVAPLWPSLRAALPYDRPNRATRPFLWRYAALRDHLLRAGELVPIEKAERRVLALANPGLGLGNMMATPSIYIGLQLILPGEVAPNHRHTPTAIRFVIEGSGGFTAVDGEKCPMEKGDLILTPSGCWHQHGHEGSGPVVWLDALDLPVIGRLELSYVVEGAPQRVMNAADRSRTTYRRAGLVPYASLGRPRPDYPLIRFPWKEVSQSLRDLASAVGPREPVHLAYVNPETGEECLPILGFSAQMLRAGEETAPPRRSSSSVIHVVEGQGESEIDGETIRWSEGDTVAVPTYAEVRHRATGARPAYVFHIDDAPLQRKLKVYEEQPATPAARTIDRHAAE